MSDEKAVIESAKRLSARDETALELLLGMRDKAIQRDPELKNDPNFEPKYEAETMGALDDIKALGRRILNRWNKELHGLVCGVKANDQKERTAILGSLNLGESAVIAAVASALLSLGVFPALAAVLAPLIVKRFVWPAKDELCDAWRERINAHA